MFNGDPRIHSYLISQLKKMQLNSSPFKKKMTKLFKNRKTITSNGISQNFIALSQLDEPTLPKPMKTSDLAELLKQPFSQPLSPFGMEEDSSVATSVLSSKPTSKPPTPKSPIPQVKTKKEGTALLFEKLQLKTSIFALLAQVRNNNKK